MSELDEEQCASDRCPECGYLIGDHIDSHVAKACVGQGESLVTVVHRLISGDRIEVGHGSESLSISVWYQHDPPTWVSAALLTPAETFALAEDLRRQAEAIVTPSHELG